jgi:hypothetical protein
MDLGRAWKENQNYKSTALCYRAQNNLNQSDYYKIRQEIIQITDSWSWSMDLQEICLFLEDTCAYTPPRAVRSFQNDRN